MDPLLFCLGAFGLISGACTGVMFAVVPSMLVGLLAVGIVDPKGHSAFTGA